MTSCASATNSAANWRSRRRHCCHARFPPQTAKRWPAFRHKPRNQNLCGEIRLKRACGRYYSTRRLLSFESPGIRIGMDVMLSDYRHWLEYDPVALAVLLVGVGFVELIVLSI